MICLHTHYTLTYRMLEGKRCPSAPQRKWGAETRLMLQRCSDSSLELAEPGFVNSDLDHFLPWCCKAENTYGILANEYIFLS